MEDGGAEVTKKGKRRPGGLKIVCSQPDPVATVPSSLDTSTTISIDGKSLKIAADDLQFVCTLGEFEESLLDMCACAAFIYLSNVLRDSVLAPLNLQFAFYTPTEMDVYTMVL